MVHDKQHFSHFSHFSRAMSLILAESHIVLPMHAQNMCCFRWIFFSLVRRKYANSHEINLMKISSVRFLSFFLWNWKHHFAEWCTSDKNLKWDFTIIHICVDKLNFILYFIFLCYFNHFACNHETCEKSDNYNSLTDLNQYIANKLDLTAQNVYVSAKKCVRFTCELSDNDFLSNWIDRITCIVQ